MKKDLDTEKKQALLSAQIVLVVLVIVAFFLLLVYINENRNTREIIYIQPVATEIEAEAKSGAETKQKSASTNKKSTTTSAKKNTTTPVPKVPTSNSRLSSLLDLVQAESTIDRVYSDFEADESQEESVESYVSAVISAMESAPEESIPEDEFESAESALESAESVPSEAPDFTDAKALQQLMEDMLQIRVFLSTVEMPMEGYPVFEDGDSAFELLAFLYIGMLKIPTDMWLNMLAQGIPVTLYVAPQLPNAVADLVVTCSSKEINWFARTAEIDWSYEVCCRFVQLCDDLLELNGKREFAYEEFLRCNPSDFVYQQNSPQYIATEPTMTYFLDLFSQSHPAVDRQTLFASYYTGAIPDEYLAPECPIVHKITSLERGLLDGLSKPPTMSTILLP